MGEVTQKKAFCEWTVDGQTYRLKLKTSDVVALEQRLKKSCLDLLDVQSGMGVPSLTTMLTIVYYAMKSWQHGIKETDVMTLFDKYIEDGGSQIDFYVNIVLEIYVVSGFLSAKMAQTMSEALQKMRAQI
ncbi:hypothetical protein KQI85_01895 [Falcatimonas sp. MSJ-15]|uniref:DUF6096 family protein n=1 Tax=Falcatimonas sp. MSJ-15 TaxID=2841515 RepID=UPI001C0F97C0|nr:DUF6096 family protein [Falcatimonas sp. MSJ-15]MBU5469126.1 hypothetical protein [Falcatimonas sp. MSJ-15]